MCPSSAPMDDRCWCLCSSWTISKNSLVQIPRVGRNTSVCIVSNIIDCVLFFFCGIVNFNELECISKDCIVSTVFDQTLSKFFLHLDGWTQLDILVLAGQSQKAPALFHTDPVGHCCSRAAPRTHQ